MRRVGRVSSRMGEERGRSSPLTNSGCLATSPPCAQESVSLGLKTDGSARPDPIGPGARAARLTEQPTFSSSAGITKVGSHEIVCRHCLAERRENDWLYN